MNFEKENCWDERKCGREPGGPRVAELGECPAAGDGNYTGYNDGLNAGRYCWRVAGTFCGGKVQGDMSNKIMDCIDCDFFKKVKGEEGLIFRI
jgi:hypothetical protein